MKLYQVGFERSVKDGIQSGSMLVIARSVEEASARVRARVPATEPDDLKLYPFEVAEGIVLADLIEPVAVQA